MNIAIWIAVALAAIILPAVALTSGGGRSPSRSALDAYAKKVRLPLTEEIAVPVVERIRRRQRGMFIGGVTGLVVAVIAAIIADGASTWGGGLVIMMSIVGLSFGGAWALAGHRPAGPEPRPVVARTRSTTLADYLAPGERVGLWMAPVAVVLGAVAGALILLNLAPDIRGGRIVSGVVYSALALVAWAAVVLAQRWVLAAPARSGSDLELAWDDAERAGGLRALASIATAASAIILLVWLVLIGESLTTTGFYRADIETATLITGISLAIMLALIAAVAIGPTIAWISGARNGYEQRRLWSDRTVAS